MLIPQIRAQLAAFRPFFQPRDLWGVLNRGKPLYTALAGACLVVAAPSAGGQVIGGGFHGANTKSPAPAPEVLPYNIESAGAWGGPVEAFEKHGDIGYVGSGQRVVVLDLSDPADVREMGSVKLGTTVMDFKVRDGLVYVVTESTSGDAEYGGIRTSGFHVVDATDPNEPQIIWSDPPTVGSGFEGVEIDLYGNYAFMRARSLNDQWLADLTDPRHPILRFRGFQFDNVAGQSIEYNSLVIRDDLAFVVTTENNQQFKVYDLSTIEPGVFPMRPQLIGSANFFANRFAHDLALDGEWAYVAVTDRFIPPGQTEAPGETIWAVDLSDPAHPTKHGSFSGFNKIYDGGIKPVFDLAAANGRLYAADGALNANPYEWDNAKGIAVFDIATDPGQPTLVASHRTHGSAYRVVADGDMLYVGDRGEGLMIMDATNPQAITQIGGFYSPAELRNMTRDGDRLYMTDPWNGLTILDVSDLARPVLLGVYQTQERLGLGSGKTALDENGLLYLAAGHSGMEVLDVSDPSEIRLVSAIRFPDEQWRATSAIAVDSLPGQVSRAAYMVVAVGNSDYLFSIDVSDPAHPVQADPTPPDIGSGWLRGIRTAPGRFVVTGNRWLEEVDGSDPMNLQITGLPHTSTDIGYRGIAYNEATGAVSTTWRSNHEGNWFGVYDVADLGQGAELATNEMMWPSGFGDIASNPLGMVVLGQFEGRNFNEITLYGLTNPAHPRALARTRAGYVGSSGLEYVSVLSQGDGIMVSESGNQDGHPIGLETFRIQRVTDRNNDDRVNVFDLSDFVAGVLEGDPGVDLNRDGRVDELDVRAFMKLMAEQQGS